MTSQVRPLTLNARLCRQCSVEAVRDAVDVVANRFVTTPSVPLTLSHSHAICSSCVTLYGIEQQHGQYCALATVGMELKTLGWASGLSEALRADLRRGTHTAYQIATRLLSELMHRTLTSNEGDTIIVPVPTSGSEDAMAALADRVSVECRVPVMRAIVRTKTRSARRSAASRRAAIARDEYSIHLKADMNGLRVILLDDVVTTGNTMAALAGLLREEGASTIMPLALDRTVSARVLQRVPVRAWDACPHCS